ncbi:hypothetical protein [Spiroplasma endosymbiont of Melieria omissa]|uniref:hypothetical protein n=1 Tax=Spiroplasma endosymbiont of Melieria omissa TaxID=3139324 RepID=UPI003CCAF366
MIENNNATIEKIRNELENAHKNLEKINKDISSTSMSEEMRINKVREYVEIKYKIKENKKQLKKLIKDNEKNLEYRII